MGAPLPAGACARYANSDPVSSLLIEFPDSFPEGRLLATLRRADDLAEKLASPEETMLAYDDVGRPAPRNSAATASRKWASRMPKSARCWDIVSGWRMGR